MNVLALSRAELLFAAAIRGSLFYTLHSGDRGVWGFSPRCARCALRWHWLPYAEQSHVNYLPVLYTLLLVLLTMLLIFLFHGCFSSSQFSLSQPVIFTSLCLQFSFRSCHSGEGREKAAHVQAVSMETLN